MFTAGVDVGGTSVKFGVFDENGEFVYRTQVPSVRNDPAQMVELIAGQIDKSPVKIDRVGVGTAGCVLTPEGTVTAGNLGWDGVPLRRMLCKRLGIPVWVDNDAQAALAGEWSKGACQDAKNAVYLTLGTGVGGALLLDGRFWRGTNNTAGELGHFITHADGEKCGCGQNGCFEAYASASALVRMGGGQRTAREIIDAARSGDPAMNAVFRRYLHELAIGVASLVMVFKPDVIVLGGGVSAAGDFLLNGVREETARMFQSRISYYTGEIRLAQLKNDAGMVGAAVLAGLNLI